MSRPYQFYISDPAPCPYISGQTERKVIAYPTGQHAQEQFDNLVENGFRRSQNIAYRPMCEECQACQATRIVVEKFNMTQSMKRIWKKNNDIEAVEVGNVATQEQYELFQKYIKTRHANDAMANMKFDDYNEMISESSVETGILEFRKRNVKNNIDENKLIAAVLFDRMSDHLSMVYSFFDPLESKRSLGTYIILHHIRKTQREGLQYCHLGYWIQQSQQMKYKNRYLPQERFINNKWVMFRE